MDMDDIRDMSVSFHCSPTPEMPAPESKFRRMNTFTARQYIIMAAAQHVQSKEVESGGTVLHTDVTK